jgi:TetR/AcrR family transcriptional repressor of lmrAB and yxaGH operons
MARLLQDRGYAATGRAQLLAECGVSNGSMYHHFPGGMEELAQAALETSGQAVARALSEALNGAASAGAGIGRFLAIAQERAAQGDWHGCPVAPTALESPAISPRLRLVAARCFEQWESLIATRLRADGWPEDSVPQTASAVLALIEGALLLARVTGQARHLASASRAVLALLSDRNRGDG